MTTATQTQPRRRSKAVQFAYDNRWMIVQIGDYELWTNCSVLERRGMPPSIVADWLQRKFKLGTKRAELADAFNALRALIWPDGAVIVEGDWHA